MPSSCSSFSEIIALDYYDGPIQGVARCAQGDCAYTFEMVAWDEGQDVRVYRLAALPAESYAQLVNALTALGEPRQPMWVPVWTFPTQPAQEWAEREVRAALATAGPPELLVSTVDNLATIEALSPEATARIGQEGEVFGWFQVRPDVSAADDGKPT